MLERGLVSRILFPAPPASYDVDSFPHDLIWVPKSPAARLEDTAACPPIEDCVPCLLLTYPSARFLIIFFHSNAEDLGRCHSFCCYIRDQFQVHVLAVEYPGYGICPGVPSGETVMENALAAMSFVTDTLQWPMDSIKVFGRSIGTGPAIGLASIFSLAGLVLVTPFLSVQELFRDRVGPLASFIEEWFPNIDSVPKITSPTMIIHGQRDELISCRHGESIYELLRPRKLLISPPDMEHNTNLLTNLQFFVLPMFQFFALPDYAFQDLHVPAWAYDKRRSPFYIRPSVEISSHQLPNNSGKKKMLMPSGDDGSMPVTSDTSVQRPEHPGLGAKLKKASEKALNGEAATPTKKLETRKLENMFSSKDSTKKDDASDEFCVADETPIRAVKNHRLLKHEGGVSHGASGRPSSPDRIPRIHSHESPQHITGRSPEVTVLRPASAAEMSLEKNLSPEAKAAIKRLEDYAGSIGAHEICSDELCVLEERMDADTEQNLRIQEKALTDLVRERQAQNFGNRPGGTSEEKAIVTPRLLAASRRPRPGGPAERPQSFWSAWCTKDPNTPDLHVVDEEVQMLNTQAPGLAPRETADVDLPVTSSAWSSNAEPSSASQPSSRKLSEDDVQVLAHETSWEGWETSPSTSKPRPSAPKVVTGDSESTGRAASKESTASKASKGQGNENVAKNPLWSACCRPLVSEAPPSPMPRSTLHDEEDPIVPFGGLILAGRQMSEEVRRNYPLGTAPEEMLAEVVSAPQATDDAPIPNGFQRGTKFAI